MDGRPLRGWIQGAVVAGRRELPEGAVLIRDGVIERVEPSLPRGARRALAVLNAHVLPGFVELHVHGAMGCDAAGADPACNDRIRSWLARQGVTLFAAAVVSSPPERTVAAVEALMGLAGRRDGPELVGILLEGPFLAPGKKGAHRPECLRLPDSDLLDRLLEPIRPPIRPLLLVAPELPGALELIARARARGVIVGLGHSAADHDTTKRALDAGASYGIHLWNAMGPLGHRTPGIVGALLDDGRATVELIADPNHVHPAVMRLTVRAAGPGRVALVTDTTGPAGLPPGRHPWEGTVVDVDASTIRLPDGTLAGSALDGPTLVRTVRELGLTWVDLARMRSETPARLLGLGRRAGRIAPGRPADLTVVADDGRVAATVVAGRLVHAG